MIASLLAGSAIAMSAPDVLPDAGLLSSYLADAYVTTSNSELPPGTRALRFSTASVNYGNGRLHLEGGQVIGGLQVVKQRIYRTDGTSWTRDCGFFTYHAAHGHIHFDDWTVFRLRRVTETGGVGEVVRTGAKTSFCILEIVQHNNSLPGHNQSPSYSSCGQVQGLRPGWADVYSSGLEGQYINLTGIPDGTYWLEGQVDPDNLVVESNESNNYARVLVAVGNPPTATADAYEENDSIAQVDALPEAGANSANIGPIDNAMTLDNLSMDDTVDWFRIRITGTFPGSYVRLNSPWLRQGNLNLYVHNSAGTQIRSSADSYNFEQISLEGLAAGTYYIRVTRSGATNNPKYKLTMAPGPNRPPTLSIVAPSAGNHYLERAVDPIPLTWIGGDPDGDPKTVDLFKSRTPEFGPTTQLIDGYDNLPGEGQSLNINTVLFEIGQWFIMARGTDGNVTTDAWAPGRIFLYKKGDMNFNGSVGNDDCRQLDAYLRFGGPMPEGMDKICDMDRNGVLSFFDLKLMLAARGSGLGH